MSCPQFGYNGSSATTQLLMAGQSGTPLSASSAPSGGGAGSANGGSAAGGGGGGQPCCESGRPVLTDPLTGQTVCSCQYDAQLLGYQRLAASGLPLNVYGTAAAAAAAAAAYGGEQGFLPLSAEQSAFYSPTANGFDLKDNLEAWRSLPYAASMYYPYDSAALAGYPFPNGYGVDLNGARRKNATRETTSTLKAWLNEHRKNPYPTKGEKIMLAIITKMTLTQVSTWFANARRRLKKENKMTWEPRNKMDADDVKDYDDDDDDGDDAADKRTTARSDRSDRVDSSDSRRCDSEDEGERRITACEDSIDGAGQYPSAGQIPTGRPYHLLPTKPHPEPPREAPLLPTSEFTPTDSSSSPNLPDIQALMRSSPLDKGGHKDPPSDHEDGRSKPKIWSLADTATSKSPEPMGAACGWFSVNPYQSAAGFGGYHSGAFAAAAASGCSGFVQTDTPPQTPPNMKVGPAGYQGGHFYQHVNPVAQGSKSGGTYPLSSRSYRPDSAPEDYSTSSGHFRSTTLQ